METIFGGREELGKMKEENTHVKRPEECVEIKIGEEKKNIGRFLKLDK